MYHLLSFLCYDAFINNTGILFERVNTGIVFGRVKTGKVFGRVKQNRNDLNMKLA